MTEWDADGDLATASRSHATYDAVWMRSLVVDSATLRPRSAPTPAMQRMADARRGAGKPFGPVLHNDAGKGFDPAFGARMVEACTSLASDLATLRAKDGWSSLQVDLESLPEKSAPQFESCLRQLVKALPGVEVGVALHARIKGDAGYEGARFQRWQELAKIKGLSFIVMAYDHAWATSPPGPVAPLAWVKKVAAHATERFGSERVTIALPTYGYAWTSTSNQKGQLSWQGAPEVARHLARRAAERATLVRRSSLPATDGVCFDGKIENVAREAICFDDHATLLLKARELAKAGVRRFAYWRMGGEDAAFFATWSKGF